MIGTNGCGYHCVCAVATVVESQLQQSELSSHCRSSLAATVSSTMLIMIAKPALPYIRNGEYDKEINFSLAQKKKSRMPNMPLIFISNQNQ